MFTYALYVRVLYYLPLLSSSGNNSIIAGDFNAKLVEWGSATDNQFGKDLQEAITLSSYHLISDEECQPTCFPWNGGRPSRTDHILISSNSLWWSDTITADSMGSDHAPLISDINGPSLPSRCISPYHRKPRWIWDKANWNKYQQMTNTISDIDADLPLKEFLLQSLRQPRHAYLWPSPIGNTRSGQRNYSG
jgi:hypothetical protein